MTTWAYVASQVAASTAAGVALTVATPTAAALAGSDQVGALAQTSTILGAAATSLTTRRVPRRVLVPAGHLVSAAGSIAAASAVSTAEWSAFLLALVAVGSGTTASLAARFAAVEASHDRHEDGARASARTAAPVVIATVLAASTVGSLLGPNVVPLLPPSAAGPFVLMAACSTVAGGLASGAALWRRRRTPHPGAPARSGTSGTSARHRARAPERARSRRTTLPASSRRGIRTSALAHGIMVALMALAPVHLGHTGAPPSVVGLVMSGHLVAMYASSPLSGAAVRRWGPDRCSTVAAVASTAAASVLAVAAATDASTWALGVGLVLAGLAWSTGVVAGSTLVTSVPGDDVRTRAQARTDLSMVLAGAVASSAAGAVSGVGGYAAVAGVAGALGTVWLVAPTFGAAARGRCARSRPEQDTGSGGRPEARGGPAPR